MPINTYSGNTFVAFCDISGFKELMKNNKKAVEALDKFYSIGYEVLRAKFFGDAIKIEEFFISDSGILFIRMNSISNKVDGLNLLLMTLSKLNRELLTHNIMLTTSIAYGPFSYQERVEFQGIEKNPIYGNAYVSAFLDNENAKPKIQPGQCRIVKKNLPEEINIERLTTIDERLQNKEKHIYFYWMVDSSDQIKDFEKSYNDSYKQKYSGMIKSLKAHQDY